MIMNDIFAKNVPGMTGVLSGATVGIAGCGGLGSNSAVALVRAGIGNLIICDHDIVEVSNLNRQYYFQEDIGKKKVDVLAGKLKSINPHCNIKIIDKMLKRDDISRLFFDAEILIEAFDLAESKQWLIEEWLSEFPERAIISGNGIAGYGEINQLTLRKVGNLYLCGDGRTSENEGLCSSRVAIVANMQSATAIELLMKKSNVK